MKKKSNQPWEILNITLVVCFLATITFLILGEIFMPPENPTEDGYSTILDGEWERVLEDGTRLVIKEEGQYSPDSDGGIRIERVLPEDQEDTWFCMRASQQDMYVYIGDELRKVYNTEETRLFGQNSASAFVFFEVYREDAGKVLSIELYSNSEYDGFINKVYTGEKTDIINAIIQRSLIVIIVSICMFIISAITVLVGLLLRVIYGKKIDITYLGLGILQLSVAMISESKLRQFFLPNSSIATHVGFMLTILIPYPFMMYVNTIQKKRYEKAYKILSSCVAANFFISTILHVFGIVDFMSTMIISYGMIVAMVIVISTTVCIDIKGGRLSEYGEVIIGMIAMIIAALWETYITIFPNVSQRGGVALSFGLMILLFVAGIKTAREMLAKEKEKQVAIASGQAKAHFLTNMSHEIRTPINTIIGMNEMILRENNNKNVEEYAKSVETASELLLGLINDILDFSKIEAGKMNIHEKEYQLSKIIYDVIKGIKLKADNKNLNIITNIDNSLPSVLKGDEFKLRQILYNLLSNAIKYTNEGNITIYVNGEYKQDIFVLKVSVEDTGIGIKPEDLKMLFISFQRLEEEKYRHIQGTGLGLSITKQLVELMGGTIEVESEYGVGSCFTFKVPQQVINDTSVEEKTTIENSDDKQTATIYFPNAEVLVVDDDEMNRKVACALLKRTGVRVSTACGGAECLELCKTHKFDLIFMDHMMPEPNGIQTLHLLNKDEKGLNIDTKVIVLTANAIKGMDEMYLQEGFSDYLTKPIEVNRLEEILFKYLG